MFKVMPAVGLEPTRGKTPPDFESSVSANFTTPAVFCVLFYCVGCTIPLFIGLVKNRKIVY